MTHFVQTKGLSWELWDSKTRKRESGLCVGIYGRATNM